LYNREITHAPVTLFLGAGASKPFGKMLMAEFINFLYLDKTFSSSPLFKPIVQKNSDLEYLFEQLESWAEKGYVERNSGPPSLFGAPEEFVGHAQYLLVELRKKVFQAYKDIDGPSRARLLPAFNELLGGIFETLDEQGYPLVIFTTNYDPAVETFCAQSSGYELEDGFANEDGHWVWRREKFDNYQRGVNKKHVILFKLHGSANWVKRGGRILRLPFPIYEGEDYENVLIYPATRKVALDDPFFTGYDYFQRTMDACGCCIVIGYSFRDYDALTKLASASGFNPRLKVLVVDPQPENIRERLCDKGIRCTAARQTFGEDIKYMHEVARHIIEAVKSAKIEQTTAPAGTAP
jgi:hypothetical protein